MKDESLTEQERKSIKPTRIVDVTPEEDDLLEAFRKLGEKKGAQAQDLAIQVIQAMSDVNS